MWRNIRRPCTRRRQQGFVLPVLIAIITVLIAISVAMTQSARTGLRQAQYAGDLQTLYVQAQLVRTKILKCSFDYPGGNNGSGYRLNMPAALADTPVASLTCPGAPAGLTALWNGMDAVWLPNPPNGYGNWTFRNDATSARIFIQANDDSGLPTLDAVRLKFSAAEASLDNNTRTLTLKIQS